jgi:hypothetical protein
MVFFTGSYGFGGPIHDSFLEKRTLSGNVYGIFIGAGIFG